MAEVERMVSWNCAGLICWSERSFLCITADSKVRWRRFVMGRGSATLNRVLMYNSLKRNKLTERDLVKAAQVFGGRRAAVRVLVLLRQGKQHSSL